MMKLFGIETQAEKVEKKRNQARAAGINPDALSTLTGHTKAVTALTPLTDGRLASGSHDQSIKLWNVQTGSCDATLTGHTKAVSALTLLMDGRLASGSYDQSIKLWNVQMGSCDATLTGHRGYVSALTPLTDGRLASSGFDDMSIKLWNVQTGSCDATLGNKDYVYALTQLTDGRLANGAGTLIKLWNVQTGSCDTTLRAYTNGVTALMQLPDGRLASGSHKSSIKLWNVQTGRCDATLTGHTDGSVNALTLLSDGRLVSGSYDKSIKLWNVQTRSCDATLTGHTNIVSALTLLSDGRLASGSYDKSIKLWDVGLRPVLGRIAEAASRATVQPAKPKSVSAEREEIIQQAVKPAASPVFSLPTPPAKPAQKVSSATPPKSAATTVESSASERDNFPVLGGLSLSQTANMIAFSELELGEELGRGGFGVVCEALWQGVTQVAVKQLLGQLAPDLLEEFQRETSVHARLRHPNIIALYGICVESMKYAMVMEFMANGSLYDVLKTPAELPWSLRLSIALDLASGLLYLHGQHIIHRDLKSLNILIDGQMRAKVSDFGLSKIKLTTASMTKGGGGTPHWMAPELFDEVGNTSATDVYATSIVFWEIAARKLPYEGKNPSQLMRFVEKGNREAIPAGTPPQFATLMTRCWSQRAEDRPSMNDVAKEMRAIIGGNSGSNKTNSPTPSNVSSGYAAFSHR